MQMGDSLSSKAIMVFHSVNNHKSHLHTPDRLQCRVIVGLSVSEHYINCRTTASADSISGTGVSCHCSPIQQPLPWKQKKVFSVQFHTQVYGQNHTHLFYHCVKHFSSAAAKTTKQSPASPGPPMVQCLGYPG